MVLAGMAEIAAGAIAMGLGGFLAARTDQEHYQSELRREINETREIPEEESGGSSAKYFTGGVCRSSRFSRSSPPSAPTKNGGSTS